MKDEFGYEDEDYSKPKIPLEHKLVSETRENGYITRHYSSGISGYWETVPDLPKGEQYRRCMECVSLTKDWNGEYMCGFTKYAVEEDMGPAPDCLYCPRDKFEKALAAEPERRKKLGLWGADLSMEDVFGTGNDTDGDTEEANDNDSDDNDEK